MFIDNISMLNDTLKTFKNGYYNKNDKKTAVKLSEDQQKAARVFLPDDIKKINSRQRSDDSITNSCTFSCENTDSFTMARKITDIIKNSDTPEERVLVLNLANPVHPGGGVRHGARAQEEDLCRKSSLLISLESKEAEKYYSYNRSLKTYMGSDAVIITPDVEIIRDENGEFLDESVIVSVVTCAAPMIKFGKEGMTEQEYEDLVYNRIIGLLKCSAYLGYKYLLLGAWGCGAFRNDARVFSDLFAKALNDFRFDGLTTNELFRRVDFAVLSRSKEQYNYKQFSRNFNKPSDNDNIRDRIRGSLVGGGIGDALGYEIEFEREKSIFSRFGKDGITEYVLDPKTKKAIISDDTQMTLFTATGILAAVQNGNKDNIKKSVRNEIEKSYFDWLTTQMYSFEESRSIQKYNSSIYDVPELYNRRAPGNTCLSALAQRIKNNESPDSYINSKVNNSKGCGGVMRVAPLGLCFKNWNIKDIDIEAAQAAAITHSHPLGYMTAAVLAHIIHKSIFDRNDMSLKDIVIDARNTVKEIFSDEDHIDELIEIIDTAIDLSEKNYSDLACIHILGEGWVAEETLAIAIYCSLRYTNYTNDFYGAMITSVNHNGDSDSTGAITGNILGAWMGLDAIDQKWKTDLELYDVIIKVADELYDNCL